MKRSFPLSVDRLEDRCVPSADPVVQTVIPTAPVVTDASTTIVLTAAPSTTDGTSPVIDPYLIDPSAPPPPPKVDPTLPPDGSILPPDQSLVPPVNPPIVY